MMNANQTQRYQLYLLLLIALLLPAFVLKQLLAPPAKQQTLEPQYVGRDACAECHQTEMTDFHNSHHDLAMDVANDSSVLGNFNQAELLRSNGERHKAYKKDNKFFVLTDGHEGKMAEYEVKYVFGHYPLQNYLVEFPGGRLQVLALTWSSIDNQWYHMTDSIPQYQGIDHHNWLHWTNQAQNWNSMCAYCHVTGFKKNYDRKTDSYNSSWTEGDVSCEACHGPASEHIRWAKAPEYAQQNWSNYGLTTPTSGLESNEQYVAMCARCHSRRGTLSDQHPHHIATYDFMQMALPIQPQWHVDGQIQDEDYVVASFMQSKMYQRGVACNDCHNVHSGERKMEGNALCLQCHNAQDYDTFEHHHHKTAGEEGKAVRSLYGDTYEVGSGSQCINCHMPAQYYMGVDLRNDHSFRVPRPDLSDELGTPNACVQCHGEESNQWAAQHVQQWHGKPYKKHWGEAIRAAIEGKAGADSALLQIIDSDPQVHPNIVRAAALASLNGDKQAPTLHRYLTDENDLLRNTAINSLQVLSADDAEAVFPLLHDARRSIRASAAAKLMNYPINRIPAKHRASLNAALDDFGSMQEYNADFPLGRFNLGNYYLMKSKLAESPADSLKLDQEAGKCYLEAFQLDTAMGQFALQLAYRHHSKGELKQSDEYFQRYLHTAPRDAQAHYDYGLLLSTIAAEQVRAQGASKPSLERKKQWYDASLHQLEKAIELEPNNANFNYNNLSQIYLYYGNTAKAEQLLLAAANKPRASLNEEVNLLNFYISTRNKKQAEALAEKLVAKYPEQEEIQQLRGWKMPLP